MGGVWGGGGVRVCGWVRSKADFPSSPVPRKGTKIMGLAAVTIFLYSFNVLLYSMNFEEMPRGVLGIYESRPIT